MKPIIQNKLLMLKIQEVIGYLYGSNNTLLIKNSYSLVTIEIFVLPFRITMF
jgi:hypothetical protein